MYTTFAEMDLLHEDAKEKETEATNKYDKLEHTKLINALLFAMDSGHILTTIRQDAQAVLNGTVLCSQNTLLTKIIKLIDIHLEDRGEP